MGRQIFILIILLSVSSCSIKTETSNLQEADSTEELARAESKQIEKISIEYSFPDFVKVTKLPDSLIISVGNTVTGDFNADGKDDFASLVINQKNGFRGVLIIHNGDKPEYFVIGVRQEINGITNLNRIEIFKNFPNIQDVKPDVIDVVTGEIIEENTKILRVIGAAIYTRFDESIGGEVLFWTGEKYDWFHMD
jgi:hypothetical protein